MAQTLKRIDGTMADVIASTASTGATALTTWTKVRCTRKIEKNVDSAAGSTFEQFTPGKRSAQLEFEGFEGLAENFSDLPAEGAELKSLSCLTDADSYELFGELADESKYGKIIVTEVMAERTEKPSTWTMKAESGGH